MRVIKFVGVQITVIKAWLCWSPKINLSPFPFSLKIGTELVIFAKEAGVIRNRPIKISIRPVRLLVIGSGFSNDIPEMKVFHTGEKFI
jgi:hypothetical protein